VLSVLSVFCAQAADAGLDPVLARPVRMPFDQQHLDLGNDLGSAHRGVSPPPGLVAQFTEVVADTGEDLRPADLPMTRYDDSD
jgi:hypothetical protein